MDGFARAWFVVYRRVSAGIGCADQGEIFATAFFSVLLGIQIRVPIFIHRSSSQHIPIQISHIYMES